MALGYTLDKYPGDTQWSAQWYAALDYIKTNVSTSSSVETLTNKTLTNPIINGGVLGGTFTGNYSLSGTYTLGGTPTITNPILDGVATGTAVSTTGGNSKVVKTDASGNVELTGGLAVGEDSVINGVTVGRGGSGISTNTASGHQSLYSNTTGGGNTANGRSALYSNTTGSDNTANGYAALYSNETGNYNTASGRQSLYSNTTGDFNTASGYQASYSNETGDRNTANGYQSLYFNTGEYNTASGFQALYNNILGNYNTTSGYLSLYNNTSGSYNTANGHSAGRYVGSASTSNTTSSYSVYVGNDSRPLADGQTNQIVIGASTAGAKCVGHGDNTATIGNSAITDTYLNGNAVLTGGLTAGGEVKSDTDNTDNLGSASFRWKEIFAGNGTINTSDAREKTEVSTLIESEINAGKQLLQEIGSFKFLASVDEKGEDARIHIGLTVQKTIEILEENGLVANDYSFICYDSWEKEVIEHEAIPETIQKIPVMIEIEKEVVEEINGEYIKKIVKVEVPKTKEVQLKDEQGNVLDEKITVPVTEDKIIEGKEAWTEVVQEAGDRYGFRYTELNQFLIAALYQELLIK